MRAARPVSEQLNGAGEYETLARVTVNIGHIAGGTSMNLIPASARAGVDIRLPVGLDAVRVEQELIHRLSPLPGVSWQMQRRSEPNFTPPDAEIVTTVLRAAEQVSGHAPVANMRVGASDSRLYRAAGVPTVVFGPTPFNMGGADEYALIDELLTVTKVHALAALTFLA
jgi:acetylornithine deacetylase/succinyl-diaminopimelate desuccinylase-like protein